MIAPAPEPEPARAPRPLVGPEDTLEDTLEDTVGEDEEAPSNIQEPLDEAEVEADSHLSAGVRGSQPEVEPATDGPSISLESSSLPSEAEVETPTATVEVAPSADVASEAGPVAELEVEREPQAVEARAAPEPSAEAGRETADQVEVGRVVVIEQEREVEVTSSPPEPETEDTPRRRWSLFRRGGDR